MASQPQRPQPGLPSNLDFERAVLGAMLLDNDVVPDVVAFAGREDFHLPAHQAIFDSMLRLFDAGSPIELNLVASDLRQNGLLEAAGGTIAIASLEQYVLSTGAAPETARRLRQLGLHRRLIAEAAHISASAYAQDEDPEKVATAAIDRLAQLAQPSGGTSCNIAEAMAEVIDELHERKTRGKANLFDTGIGPLDSVVAFGPGDLILLGARPGVGKTALALMISMHFGKVHGGAQLFSLEMGRDQLAMRILAESSNVPLSVLRKSILRDTDLQILRDWATHIAKLGDRLRIEDPPAITMAGIRARAIAAKRRNPDLSLIVVDYLQLITREGHRHKSTNDEVGEVSKQLKALARELKIPVLALTQLSRDSVKRDRKAWRPTLADLRDSGNLEQDADTVLLGSRALLQEDGTLFKKWVSAEGATASDSSGNEVQPIVIDVAKYRHDKPGAVALAFDGRHQRFGPMAVLPARQTSERRDYS